MTGRLAPKVVVVTGGGTGIGRAVVIGPGTAGAAGRWQAVVQRPGRASRRLCCPPDEKE